MCNILRSTLQICSEYETVFMFMINYRVSAWNSVLNPLHHDNGEMRLYYVKATFSSCWQFWHFTWTRYAYSCGKNTLCFQLRICPCSILLSCLSAVYVIMKYWLLYCLRGSEEWLFKKHYITAHLSWTASTLSIAMEMFYVSLMYHYGPTGEILVSVDPQSTQWDWRERATQVNAATGRLKNKKLFSLFSIWVQCKCYCFYLKTSSKITKQSLGSQWALWDFTESFVWHSCELSTPRLTKWWPLSKPAH